MCVHMCAHTRVYIHAHVLLLLLVQDTAVQCSPVPLGLALAFVYMRYAGSSAQVPLGVWGRRQLQLGSLLALRDLAANLACSKFGGGGVRKPAGASGR